MLRPVLDSVTYPHVQVCGFGSLSLAHIVCLPPGGCTVHPLFHLMRLANPLSVLLAGIEPATYRLGGDCSVH